MQKRLEKIADNNITRSPSKNSALARLNGLWAIFERSDTVLIVISADPDAIASAMALKRLLSYRVQSVAIGYPNEIRRLNNMTMVERLKIPIERLHTPAGEGIHQKDTSRFSAQSPGLFRKDDLQCDYRSSSGHNWLGCGLH